jgi:hypothetical protein
MRVCSILCRCAFHLFLYSIIFSLKAEMPNSLQQYCFYISIFIFLNERRIYKTYIRCY